MKLLFILTVYLLAFLINFVTNEDMHKYAPWIFLYIFLGQIIVILRKNDVVANLYLPSSVMILYVSFFFFMGTFAFKYGLVQLDVADQWRYYQIENFSLITSYFVCSIATIMFGQLIKVNFHGLKRIRTNPFFEKNFDQRMTDVGATGMLLSVFLILVALGFEIPLPGGTGSFSAIFFFFSAIYVSYYVRIKKLKIRFVVYFFIVTLLAYFFYSDRRLVAFYLFIVFFIENIYCRAFNVRIKNIVVILLIITLFVIAVVAMSIQRGVGDFGEDNFFKALFYVRDYFLSDWAITMLLHNMEGPGTTFHSYNAINYVIINNAYSFGTTIFKFIFIPVPRTIFFDKPNSMVWDYTSYFYPTFRQEGGSYVPNLLAEFYWNFGFIFGLISIMIIFIFFDILYKYMIESVRGNKKLKNVFMMSVFSLIVFYFRGSGLDLYMIYAIVFFLIYIIYYILVATINLFLKGVFSKSGRY